MFVRCVMFAKRRTKSEFLHAVATFIGKPCGKTKLDKKSGDNSFEVVAASANRVLDYTSKRLHIEIQRELVGMRTQAQRIDIAALQADIHID